MRFLITLVILLFMAAPVAAQVAGLTIARDIRYAETAGTSATLQSLDIYSPANASKAPVVILVHGGGWQTGSKSSASFVTNKVAYFSARGFVTVSINYRLSPAVVHPAHVDDVAAALAWTRRNIPAHGGDPERIFLLGHSAGAHLVSLIATDETRLAAQGETLAAIKGVIVLDTASFDISTRYAGGGDDGSGQSVGIIGQAFGSQPFGHRDASPQIHVASNKSVPAFLLCYVASRSDSPIATQQFAAALTTAGVANTVLAGQGYSHETINTTFGLANEPTTLAATAFLDAQLAVLAPQLDARYSGTWFDPLRSGEGLQFEFSQFADGQRVAIVTWYTYDLAGQPIYLGGSSTYQAGATRVTVPLVSTSGARFGTGFNSASIQRIPWGVVDLEFPDCSNSRVTYRAINLGFGNGELRLSRIAAPAPRNACSAP